MRRIAAQLTEQEIIVRTVFYPTLNYGKRKRT